MDAESAREHCLLKAGATEGFPFGEDTLVFKVGGKIFALLSLSSVPTQINLKCEPEKAIALRAEHPAVRPGYHMNKTHWNTVVFDGSLPHHLLEEMIEDSYRLVFNSLSRKARAAIDAEPTS